MSVRRQPQQDRAAATVAAVLRAARSLVQERDLADITVRTVADRAGLSPAAVYRYFTDIEQVVAGVLREHAAVAEEAVASALAASRHRSVEGVFRHVVATYLALYDERPELTVELRPASLANRHRELEASSDRRLATSLGEHLARRGLIGELDAHTVERLAAHWNAVGAMIGAVLRADAGLRPALEADLYAMVTHAARRFHPFGVRSPARRPSGRPGLRAGGGARGRRSPSV